MRIGIRNELAEQIEASDFVLGKLTDDELDALSQVIVDHLEEYIL